MIDKIYRMANKFDKMGLYKEADILTNVIETLIKKSASNEYDLNELNKEVRLDQAIDAIGKGMSSGEDVDLSPFGIKSIHVKQFNPENTKHFDEPIDPHAKRDNFQQFDGIALDHAQGIAFGAQALKNYLTKIMSTFKVIWDDFMSGSESMEPFWQRLEIFAQLLEDLNEDAQMQMTRAQDFDQSWANKGKEMGNVPIWSAQNLLNKEYNEALDNHINQEKEWSFEKSKEFWSIWSNLREFMFEFKSYVPYGPYKQLWDELTPV